MSNGILLFGINNDKINYIRLAIIAAMFAKKNMDNISVSLISDQKSLNNIADSDKAIANELFKNIIKIPADFNEHFNNTRAYKDTQYYSIISQFKNESRSLAYELTPYDETLLIDSDFLICNSSFNYIWGNKENILINREAITLLNEPLSSGDIRLNSYGIKMYWATLIYFKKCNESKILFDLVEHIRDNWDFYKLTYNFEGVLFRNDFAFSIAIHILNGFVDSTDNFQSLPIKTILTATDLDQLYKVNSLSDLTFFANDIRENWKFRLSRIKELNVHCINKISLLNNYDNIVRKYYE